MINIIRRTYLKLHETRWLYIFKHSMVRVDACGSINVGKNVLIKKSHIYIGKNCNLVIEDNVRIEGVQIFVINNSNIKIGKNSMLIRERNSIVPEYIADNATINIGHHSLIKTWRIWCRFGGCLTIGNYTNINFGSEIRCDKSVMIGDFCQISYNVKIWDTNTHRVLPPAERRQITIEYFPSFGKELNNPSTAEVTIGNDCWIGEACGILKGTKIGDRAILGFNTIVCGNSIPKDSTTINNITLRIISHDSKS